MSNELVLELLKFFALIGIGVTFLCVFSFILFLIEKIIYWRMWK